MMTYLVAFTPFQPSPGLAIWSLLIFLVFWFMMSKFALKPIANSLKKRENDISHALEAAEKAKKELAQLRADNEVLLNEAREEKMKMLAEAREMKNNILSEAKEQANTEANRIIQEAHHQIEQQKNQAMQEVKNEVATMALDVAEKILKQNLSNQDAQQELAHKLLADASLS